jgi:hypothetical protein
VRHKTGYMVYRQGNEKKIDVVFSTYLFLFLNLTFVDIFINTHLCIVLKTRMNTFLYSDKVIQYAISKIELTTKTLSKLEVVKSFTINFIN